MSAALLSERLLQEAVNAARTMMLAGDVTYIEAAAAAVARRSCSRETYGWPELTLADELSLLHVIARRAAAEDAVCRCGAPSNDCEHGDDMAAERPAEAAGF